MSAQVRLGRKQGARIEIDFQPFRRRAAQQRIEPRWALHHHSIVNCRIAHSTRKLA